MHSFGFECQVTFINYNLHGFAFLGSHHHLMTEETSTLELRGRDICFLIFITELSDQYFLTSWGRKAAKHSNYRGDKHLCPPSQPRGMDRNIAYNEGGHTRSGCREAVEFTCGDTASDQLAAADPVLGR